MPHYFPIAEAKKRAWLHLFKENLPLAGQKMGINSQIIQTITDKVETMIQKIDKVNQKESELSLSIEERNEDRGLSLPDVFKFVNGLRTNSQYLKSIGEMLGIELNKTKKSTRSLPHIEKLEVSMQLKEQKVCFNFKKPRGVSIIIYCRRNGEEFIQLRQVLKNQYEDVRPNANQQLMEKREYRFSMTKNDVETEVSAVYPIAVI